MTRFRRLVFALILGSLAAFAPALHAATLEFRVFLDDDNSTGTGCTVSGMDGVDQVLITRVETSTSSAAVTGTSRQTCEGGTLGSPTVLSATGWPAGFHAPSGRLLVETRIPFSSFHMASSSDLPRDMRVGVEATRDELSQVALTDRDGSIVLLPEPPHGRRRSVAAPGTPRTFTLDGLDNEWTALDAKFDGIGAGGSFGLRILRVYAFVNTADDFIYFLYDATISPDAPFADDDRHKRIPGEPALEIPAPGVLGNDVDSNTPPEPLTARPISAPLHGTVVVNTDGSFTYTPENPGSRAADVFEYRANNGIKDSNIGKVKIKVGIGADDAYNVAEGTALHVDAPGVLGNDDGGNIEGLTATLLSEPSHGDVTLNPNGGFTYTPDAGFVGDDTFTYTVSGHGPSDTATVTITLDSDEQGQDNQPPHVLKDKFKVDENSPAGTLVGKVKVTDPNSGDTHTFIILSGNTGNAFAINASTGQITVAAPPHINFETLSHYDLVVRAADNGNPSLSDSETIQIDVVNKNDAPAGAPQTVTTPEEVPLPITLSATDEDGNSLTYSIGVNPAHGVLTGVPPNVTYTPNQNYVGPDSFTFLASDGTASSAPTTININVTAVNDEPLFTAGPDVTVNEDSGAYSAPWATGVAAGPANATDELGSQTVSFNVSNNNTGLFLGQPSIAGDGTLTFTPALNANGFATVTATVVDNGSNTLPNDNTGATVTFTITVSPVNDPPSFVKGPDQSVGEDSGLHTALGWATLISPGPADEAGQTVAFNIVTNTNPGLFATGPTITPTGDLSFTPALNASGVATITITLSDNGGGTNTSASQQFTITVNADNDAPVNTVPAAVQVTPEETAIVFNAANGNAIQTSDVDVAGGTMQFQLGVSSGTLTLATTSGLTITTGTDGVDEASIIGTGTLSAINAALNGLSYTPALDYFGSDTLTLVINDNGNTGSGGAQSDTDTVTISITAVDDSPTLTAGGGSPAFVEDAGPVAVDPAITPADVDNTNLVSATVTITNLLDAGLETLAANTGGTSITAVYAAPTLTLTGSDTLANYQTVLRSITYENTSGAPSTTARSITFVVNDGNSDSNTVTKSVSVTPANDAPVLTAGGGSPTFTEDGAAAVVDSGLTISDVDNTTLASATVAITNLLDGSAETLAVNVGATGLIAAYSAPTLTLTGSATLAQYETVLRTVTYSNSSNTPSTTARVISFQVNDGAANSNTVTTSVSVVANDDAPVLTAGGASPVFTEDGGAVAVDPAITPSDVDSANLTSATVTITNLLDAGLETLAASTGGTSITALYAAPTLTLTGSDTLANYQTVLRSITYDNTSQNPNTTARSITFVVNDGTSNSNTVTKTLTVNAANDAPVVTSGVGAPVFTEDGAPVLVDNGLTISDVDDTNLESAAVTITNLLDSGAETLAVNVGVSGLIANYAAPTLTLTGTATLAQYETVLRTVTYSNSSNTPNTTARSISFVVNDGTVNSNTASKSVAVVATNDAPVLTAGGGSPAFTEGAGAVAIDPAITPTDVDNGTLASATVTITNLLDAGLETLAASTGGTSITALYAAPTLTLTGVDTLANYQTVLRSITYDNSSNAPNTTGRSITFVVNDGAANSNTVTKTVSITTVNSAPTLVAGGGAPTFVEDAGPVAVDNGITPADVDSTTLASATITITNPIDGAAELLAATTGGTSIIANYVAPTLTLTGVDSIANYQTVLRSVTYENTSNTPDTTARVISFTVNDGSLDSNTTTKNVAVVPANDAPVVTTTVGNTSFTEGAGAVTVDSGVTPTDVDSASLASATVTITNLLDAGLETLAASTGGTSIVAVYAAPVLTLTGVDTKANYQTVLRSVTYDNSSNAPNPTNRIIAFQVNDGALPSNVANKTVTVTSVNSAPTVTTSGGTTAFVEDAGAVLVDTLVTPADVDSTTLASAQVTITNLLDSGLETLTANTGGTSIIASYVAPTLTLSGVDSIANYQTVLRSVAYNNTSNTPNTTTRSISFKVNDGSIDSNVPTKSVSITPANDAPSLATTAGTTPFTEDGGAPFIDTGVTITDPDSPTMASATVTIANLLNAGAELLAADTTGTSIIASYVAPTLTLSGVDSIANYHTVLRKVTYDNTSQNPNTTNRTISFQVNDGAAASNIPTRLVSVTAVNDAPSVTTSVGTTPFVEDAGPVVVDSTVTPADVDNTTLASATVTITNLVDVGFETLAANVGGTSIIANYSAPTLTLTGVDSIANYQTVLRSVTYNNSSNAPTTTTRTISFKVNDGLADSNIPTKSVSVTASNDAPALTASGTLAYTENQAATALNVTIGITDPDSTNMSSATVTITGNPQLAADVLAMATQNGISANYVAPTLTLTGPSSIANYITALQSVTYQNTSDDPSTAARTITYQVNDGTANSNTGTSTINITATNDAPTNNPPTNAQSVNEDTPLNFTGAGNTVSVTDPDAQSGSNFTVQVVTTNGTTTIVTPVGVTFTPPAGNGTASYTITGTLANINASLATLRFNPTLNFPNALASGTATVQLITNDGGNTPAPAQGDNDTFNITVNQVNDAPTAGNDAWDTIGNTELRVDLAAGLTPNVADTTPSTKGVADNDSDLAAENNPFTVTSIVGCVDVATPYDCTLPSGSIVSMDATGTFTFKPSPTIATGTPTDDTFQYVITDQPAAGTPMTATGTVTIHVFDKVWYVKQGGTGNGRSDSPLGSFTGINNAGGVGDSDSPTDYIFVHTGSSITTSIELEANQHLLGEGVGLSINRNLNTNGAPTNLVAAGTKPILTSATNTVAITAATPVEVRGLNLSSSAGNPIDLTSAGAYSGSPSLMISDNLFTTASAEDIDVNAGATGTLALTIQNNDWVVVGPHSSQGIDVRTTAGTLNLNVNTNTNVNVAGTGILIDGSGGGTMNITGFNDNFVHQNTIGNGITVTSATFDTTPGVPFQTVAGGTTRVGTVGNGVGGAGMVLTNVAGDLSFTDLDITNDSGSGLAATGLAAYTGSAGFQITVPAGVATITTANGPAVNLSTVTANLPLSTISSTNSTSTGVSLNAVLGTFSAPAGSVISNATTTDFNITGGTANVTYNGTITDDQGQLVNISGVTGTSTKAFTGAITDGDDGDGNGISLTGNTATTTMRFSGGVVLSTGGNPAFTATGGGLVEVCDENPCAVAIGALVNKITTTTGTALNVATTTIGANNLEFRSITAGTAASGPANGIILNNTGANGFLTVYGAGTLSQGGDASGGTIQRTTGHGIALTQTFSPRFRNVTLDNTAGSGINGTQVTDFSFTYGTISNSGTGAAVDDSNISFNDSSANANVTGTVTITNSNFTNSRYHGIDIQHYTGTIAHADIEDNNFTSQASVATSLGTAVRLDAYGTAGTVGNVTKATIDNNVITNFPTGAGFHMFGGNSNGSGPAGTFGVTNNATNIIAVTNNRMDGGSLGVGNQPDRFFTGGVTGTGQGNFNISNNGTVANPITHIDGVVIELNQFGTGTMSATVNNNRIQAFNAVGSVGINVGCDADSTGAADNAAVSYTVQGNNVSQTDGNGIFAIARGSQCTMTAKILSNTVAAPATTSAARPGIRVHSGSAGSANSVCLEMSGNNTAGSTNTLTATTAPGIELRRNLAADTFNIEGLPGTPAGTPNVENYINSINTSASGTAGFGVGGTVLQGTTSGYGTCTAP